MSYARTTYTRMPNRGEDAQGRAKVSREELADFKRKYGADKTLRDLLNYDRTGKLPEAKAAPKADAKPAGPRRDMAAEAKGAETLARMKSRAERGMSVRSNEEMRDEAKGRTLGALGAAATVAGGPMAGRGLMSAMERRAASEGAKRIAKEEARKEPAFDVMERGAEMGMKKGGTAKAYAKGGSVKGGGCEARSKKTRFI